VEATVETAPKLKVLDLEEEEVVVAVIEDGSGTNGSVLVGPTVAVFSGLEEPKLKAGMTGAVEVVEVVVVVEEEEEEEDVDTWRLEEFELPGRLNVTVGVLTELTGLVGSEVEEGEEMVPKEKGVAVVEVTEVSVAVVLSLPSVPPLLDVGAELTAAAFS